MTLRKTASGSVLAFALLVIPAASAQAQTAGREEEPGRAVSRDQPARREAAAAQSPGGSGRPRDATSGPAARARSAEAWVTVYRSERRPRRGGGTSRRR